MPYVIASACIDVNDKSCVEECPVDCIYEGERKSYINPKECIDCGACEPVCPVEAISQDRRVADDDEQFVADNRAFFTEVLDGPRRAARRTRRRPQGRRARHRHPAGPGLGMTSRRPPARRRARARPGARLARAGVDRLGAGLRAGRHPRGPLGRRRRAASRPARRAVRGAGRRPRAAVLRVLPEGHRLPALRGPAADRRAQPGRASARSRTSTRTCTSRSPTRCGRQLDHGAAALKLHPVHGGFRCDDAMLYPAYQVLAERGVPLVVHCGTSTFPGSMNELADPAYLLPVVRDFPTLDVVLAHGGRGWWYDAAAFMALSNPTVWIELSGLPPKRLPDYYAPLRPRPAGPEVDLRHRLARGPEHAQNARAVVGLGLDDDVAAGVLGGNALRVYAGLDHLA